ncbi:MAG: SH3 domain-containing protein [Clostridia bacterium]
MKKIQKIALVLIIILAIILGLTYTTFAVTGKITVETVRVREEATTESKTLVMGNLGEEVEVLGQEGDWYKVKYNEQEGYIYKDYVETTEPVEETPETTENPQTKPDTTTTEETNTSVATELGNTLNKDSSAYLLPNYTSTKIAELKQSEQVKIISTLANWAKIETAEKEAWIPKTLLMKEVSINETSDSEENNPQEVSEEQKNLNQAAYISSNAAANLREGPSTETASLGKLARHTKITVISDEGEWYKVTYNGQEGYISKALVTIGEPPVEDTTSSRSSEISRASTQENYVVPSASAGAATAASIAANYIGCSYVYGGSSPSGFDCSGFTSYCYSQAGISISRTSYSQATQGTAVSKADLQPGDLVVFSGASHVGIYVGNGQFIHAANPSEGVRYDSISSGYWAGQYQSARRF